MTKTLTLSLLALALPACDVEDLDDSAVNEQFAALGDEGEADPALADDADATMLEEALVDGLDDLADPVDPAAASCVGYYNGGNFCLASCWDNPGYWVAVGHITNTSYGQCSAKVDAYCAWHWGTYGACWGWP